MRAAAALPLSALAVMLAGCIDMAPAYHRVTPQVSTRAFEADASQSVTTAPGWREVYLDPRLRTVVERALASNRDLRIAAANVAGGRAAFAQQRAALMPRLNLSGSAYYAQQPASVASGKAAASGQINEKAFTFEALSSAFELDVFGKVKSLTRAAFNQYLASRSARDSVRLSLIGSVGQAWLAIGADRESLSLAQASAESAARSLALISARHDAGVDSDLDLQQARGLEASARYNLAQWTRRVAADRTYLELLTGGPIEDALLPDRLPADALDAAGSLDHLPSSVLLNRPDVAQAEDLLRAANANIGAARAAFFPDISLTETGGFSSLSLSSLFRGAAQTWSFAPAVAQPVFQGGANLANLAGAQARRDAARAAYERAVQVAFRDAADALDARRPLTEQLAAEIAAADAAATTAHLVEARFERGSAGDLEVFAAGRARDQAALARVNARLAVLINRVTLYTALGGGAQ